MKRSNNHNEKNPSKPTVAVAIPRHPADAERNPPVRKQREYLSPSAQCPEGGLKKYIRKRTRAVTSTNPVRYLYSVVRKALAPTLI